MKRNEFMKKPERIIISGGGTGGHIFPALAIANKIKDRYPECEILFVGANGRMEMERIPAAGYKIIGLDIAGFDRKHLLKNLKVLWQLYQSLRKAKKIIKEFKPDAVVGVGGFASGPTLKMATSLKIPTLIQEQNSYAGVTNKLLAKKADCFCVAYEGMEKFFPKDKIVYTGNPVRKNLKSVANTSVIQKREEAAQYFGLDPNKKVVLFLGGSLGARTINISIKRKFETIQGNPDIQFIWQTGGLYIDDVKRFVELQSKPKNLWFDAFITRMDLAYSLADLVVSRAGAGTISELCLLGKASILVPSPNVAEDHQTKNALALVRVGAAEYVPDNESIESLLPKVKELINNEFMLESLSHEIIKLAKPDAADEIVDQLVNLINKKER